MAGNSEADFERVSQVVEDLAMRRGPWIGDAAAVVGTDRPADPLCGDRRTQRRFGIESHRRGRAMDQRELAKALHVEVGGTDAGNGACCFEDLRGPRARAGPQGAILEHAGLVQYTIYLLLFYIDYHAC